MDEPSAMLYRGALFLALTPVGVWVVEAAAAREGVSQPPRPPALRAGPVVIVAASHLSALASPWFWPALASLPLAWALIALAWIDWRRMLLPDFLTLPLIAAGLAFAWVAQGAAPFSQMIGAAAGFLVLAGLAEAYRRWRGREGLGLGDAKLLAAGGAWAGWAALPSMLLLGALAALVFLAGERALGGDRAAGDPVPFGPFLAAAIWAVWLFGPLRLVA